MLNFLNRRKTGQDLRNDEGRNFLNYNVIKKVLVLFNLEDHEDVANVVNELRKNGKIVAAWTIRPKNSETHINYFPCMVRIIDPKTDMTWTQSLSKNVIEQFKLLDYETLIDLTSTDDSTLDYLFSLNTSRFCIGFRERDGMASHDFIVLKNNETSFTEAFKYLKNYLHKNVK